MGSQGRYLKAREPQMEQNVIPPTVDIMQIARG